MASSTSNQSPASSSNAIAIPTRKNKLGSVGTSASAASSVNFAYGSFASTSSSSVSSSPSSSPGQQQRRRESLMSATFSKADYTVINVGEEESPRLITCIKASQGFDWNQEIFLPSYADVHFDDLERRQDPVVDVVVTDEEVQRMFPS
ncbi:hypothetical protein FB567DRAFT_531467 [Paraphoma chrysanthemicola]|uniref:Uncharacterized protein n=1 Tax=Paraphoma chrysanthemicola TaxID=798071 RepID=A0A8K0VW95_9PLEO|nr:hypothetical protein FB567DRAFT_531467 [Paraphoma chrysanthemicola]